jgi:hypothetical protein
MHEARMNLLVPSISTVLERNSYRPLPPEAEALCVRAGAPPRLLAHLILVHDVALALVEKLGQAFPDLPLNRELILFGAATHDLGKTLHSEELIKSGSLHESSGIDLLKKLGVSEERARFSSTHRTWKDHAPPQIEDLLVALADKCWKGKRVEALEEMIVACLSNASGVEPWQCYSMLDEIVQNVAAEADARLSWQMSFPVE